MALRVWLPLNGDLENKGISNIEVINNGATINNNGKLGQCYNFNSNNIVLKNIDLSNISSLSVTCWIKDSNTSSTQAIINCRTAVGNGLAIFLLGGKIRFDIGNTNCTFDWTYNLSNWTHICCTAEGNVRKLYVNGILQQEKTVAATYTTFGTIASIGMSSANTASPSGNILYADLNDFRIYDHCLSAKEVKEISQGLILHYKLNGLSGGVGDNLAQNTRLLDIPATIGNKYASKRGASVLRSRDDGFNEIYCTSNWQGISLWANEFYFFNIGDIITYSFYIYTNGSSRAFSFYPMMFNSTGQRDTSTGMPISCDGGSFTTVNSKPFTSTITTIPEKHYVTFEWNQAVNDIMVNGGSIELSIQVHGTWNTGDWACIYAPKLEKGSIMTAWSPAPEDLGIDTGKIIDSSGYENYSYLYRVHFVSQQGPRYNVVADFSRLGLSSSPELSMSRGNTIAFWCSAPDWSEYNLDGAICQGSNWGITSRNNNLILELISHIFPGNSDYSLSQTYSWTLMPTSSLGTDWHYFVLTYLNHEIKFYLDGILYKTINNISTDIADYFYTIDLTLSGLPFA